MGRLARQLAFGLLAGALLSAMRAPGGLDLLHLAFPSARDAALFRAAALFALVLPLDAARRAFRGGVSALALLVGACAGFALHGLFLAARFEPQSRVGFTLLVLLGTGALFLAAGGRVAEPEAEVPPARRERLGLLFVGLGLALAFEHLARYARLFGVGLPEDDTVLGGVLLACGAVGALAFGSLVSRKGAPGALAASLGALAVAGTLVGLRFADHLEADPARDPFHNYLERFGLDVTLVGTLPVTALLAAAIFVVPAFGLGAALSAAGDARRWSALVTGAALGMLFLPWVMTSLSTAVPAAELASSTWSFLPWAAAMLCALLGALATLIGAPRGASRTAARAFTALALAALVLAPRLAVWPFSPWYIVPIVPELALPAAEGLFTVERERGGARIVTLDRKLLTPTAAKEEVDARRIEWSWGLLPAEVRSAEPRVLFVGQLTPVRARTLAALGAMRLERCAPWSAPEALEELLFEGEAPPPGARIDAGEARARLRAGSYDLVIVAPVQGPLLRPKSAYVLPWGAAPAPVTAGLDVPDGTLAVAWIDAGAPLVARALGERVVLAAKHFDDLSLGLVLGERELAPEGERLSFLATGEPHARPSAWTLLQRRADYRARAENAALCARLRDANEGTEEASLARGLALHYAAQETSSPFEGYSAQIEIREDELRELARAAEKHLDPFVRATWDDLALLLAEKRMADLALVYLEPLMRRYAPWPRLERGVAYAYSEFGMYDEALALLDGVLERDPWQIDLLLECARLAREGADSQRGLGYLERALAIQPGHLRAEIEHAAVLQELGDPRGRARLEELRALHPEEDSIALYLAAPPDSEE